MSEWISVKDYLPQRGKVCLLYETYPKDHAFNCLATPLDRSRFKLGGIRYDDKFVSYEHQHEPDELKYISHWMELPEGPEKKNDDHEYDRGAYTNILS